MLFEVCELLCGYIVGYNCYLKDMLVVNCLGVCCNVDWVCFFMMVDMMLMGEEKVIQVSVGVMLVSIVVVQLLGGVFVLVVIVLYVVDIVVFDCDL